MNFTLQRQASEVKRSQRSINLNGWTHF